MAHPTIIPLSQLESMIGVDVGESTHLDAVMSSPTVAPSLSPLPLNRPDNAWVRFEAEVRSKHAMALMRLRRLWESGGAYVEDVQPLLRLLEIEEVTRCQAFQACVMGEERSHVYQAAVRSILEKLLGKLETYSPAVYQGAVQCLSDYMSALNHHCEICVVPPPPSALPAIAEGSAVGYATSQLTGYSSESCSEAARSETRSEAARSEDTLSVCSVQGVAEAASMAGATYVVESMERRHSGGAGGAAPDRAERRRESNKKAASKYRSKKTATMSSLMADNTALRQQVATLSSQSAVLAAENKLLTQQVAFLQKMLSGRGGGGDDGAAAAAGGGVAMTPAQHAAHAAHAAHVEEQRHLESLLESLNPDEGALSGLDGSLHPELEARAEPADWVMGGTAPDAAHGAAAPAPARFGLNVPAEVRCGKAFSAVTSADTDLLGFSTY